MSAFLQPKLPKIGSTAVMFEFGNGGSRKFDKNLVINKLPYFGNENKNTFPNTYKTITSIKKEEISIIDIFHIDIFSQHLDNPLRNLSLAMSSKTKVVIREKHVYTNQGSHLFSWFLLVLNFEF